MPCAFSALFVHVVFSTKDRAPHLSPDLAERLFPYLGGIVRELKGSALEINGPADHVHLLLAIPPNIALADLLRVLKTSSSRWVHDRFPARKGFAWQAGYSAFTVSASRLEQVRRYIASQQTHHRKTSYQEEILALLRKHGSDTYVPGLAE
jgi:REP element-mobilizing transposase RayT